MESILLFAHRVVSIIKVRSVSKVVSTELKNFSIIRGGLVLFDISLARSNILSVYFILLS